MCVCVWGGGMRWTQNSVAPRGCELSINGHTKKKIRRQLTGRSKFQCGNFALIDMTPCHWGRGGREIGDRRFGGTVAVSYSPPKKDRKVPRIILRRFDRIALFYSIHLSLSLQKRLISFNNRSAGDSVRLKLHFVVTISTAC